ncbi:MAG TPA: flagellar basal body P-ring formation chaperone FlgA [Candidatus Acidoferrales bacterium]|nr:flagellar basal body P-ring formation chaperone FlgA [Candidatus Acidoferrales bacterium]
MIRTLAAALVLALAWIACVPATVRAQAATQVLPGKRLEALAAPVSKRVPLQGDAQLVQAFPIPDQVVPAGRLSLAVETAIVTSTYVNVPIEVDLNGKFLRQIFVGYRVQRYVQTAVAAHDLVPGAVLEPGDLKMARIAYTGQRTNGMEVLLGRRVIEAVRAGAPVAIEETMVNQLVKAGSTVTLIVSGDGVSVVADVVARNSGGLGDEINVYDPKTNKTLTGTIVGPDRVELNISGETQ